MERIKQKSLAYQLDALCIVEQNQNLRRLPIQRQLKQVTQGWWQHRKVCQAYNRHFDTTKEQQIGGTSIIIIDSLAHRSTGITNDPTGLGRWTSILIKGKQGFSTRIICAYRPCKSSGPETAYVQHALYFHRIQRKGDPRKLFMDDLADVICKWQQLGERIILVGDFNTGDKPTMQSKTKFWEPWLKTTGLIDVHQSFFNGQNIPSTHERGKSQIDYMFVSPGISIQRAGFLPFSKFPGDHRALWMDLSMLDIVGYKPPSLPLHQARRLKLQDPRVVNKYISCLKKLSETENILESIKILGNIDKKYWSVLETTKYQQLSTRFRELMLVAESQCRKFHTGAHPWSPRLDKARRQKFYWELTVKKLQGLHVPMRKLLKLHKSLRIPFVPNSLPLALANQRIAHTHYKQIKRHSRQHRRTFQEGLASVLSTQKNIPYSSVLRNLITREEIRETHRRIKWMRGKVQGLSTSGVLITDPKSSGNKILVTDKNLLEGVIIQENEHKFHQTEKDCPLLKGTLYKDIGICTTGPSVLNTILDGTYNPPPSCSRATKAFLTACQKPRTDATIGYDYLSKENYILTWSKAKERTGSGQTHFGHWKAALNDEDLTHAEWLLTTLPAVHGFSPNVWQCATDVMILKKEGVLDIDKLRTIVLYEADFNFLNKCIGHQMMDNAIRNNNMAAEQYAKPGSSAQEQCLTRCLIFDLVRYTRTALAMASSDLKSCYDRIVHNAASLVMQKNGISQQTVTVMFDTIQKCQHKIRTAYGDSDQTYGGQGSFEFPPMGVGQGNGAGPQMWSVLSATLFLAMHMEGLGTQFCQKMTDKFISLIGFMYVDDMDLIRIRDDTQKHLLTEDLQLTLKYWNKLVRVTGGALEPKKSGWYAFHQKWDPLLGSYYYEDLGQCGDITTTDKTGKRVPLSFVPFSQSQEMLGVKMTPTGNFQDQLDSMLNIAIKEARHLTRGQLSETDTRQAVVTSIIPRLTWPLPCMSISPAEGKKILRPVLQAALPKMGIISNLGYDYIHGSSNFQGLGIPELYHSCYTLHLEMLLDHTWKHTQTGHFIQMAIQEFVLEAGSLSHPLLPNRKSRLPHWLLTQNTWFASLYNYVLNNNIKINLDTPCLASNREYDRAIMDILDTSSQFSNNELKDVNVCRIYKKVTLLSDIVNGDGSRIAHLSWSDQPIHRPSKYPYNPQEYPIQHQWLAWKKALSYIDNAMSNGSISKLGLWTMDDASFRSKWDYFIDASELTLLHRNQQNIWTRYAILPSRTRQIVFSHQGTNINPPVDWNLLHRTTIHPSPHGLFCEGHSPCKHNPILIDSPDLPVYDLIKKYGKKFSDSIWALKHLEVSESIEQLLTDFAQGKAIMVSDGSYDDILGLGAGACIVASADGTEFIITGGPTPGPISQQSAYRSEISTLVSMGILSQILAIITSSAPRVTVACDNDNALERPFLPQTRLTSKQKSADLISLAHDIWLSSPATPNPTRVTGHADEKKDCLSLLEQLNCVVDNKAKSYLQDRPKFPIYRTGDPKYGLAHITINGEDITGQVSTSIQEYQSIQRSKAAGIRRNRFSSDSWGKLDHEAIKRSTAHQSTYKKIFITKWISKQLPLGKNMVQRKHRLSDNCPYCLAPGEDLAHLHSCHSVASTQLFFKNLEKLATWLKHMDTDPVIHHHLISVLSIWRSHNKPPFPYPCILTKRKYYEAFKEQESIGWQQFMEGLLTRQWSVLQHQYYQSIQSRRSGKVWASLLTNYKDMGP
jgi:hypothetical protein